MLYVKPLDGRRLLVELLAAQVGLAMGVPCARPFFVLAEPSHMGLPGTDLMHAFGSEMAGHPAIARPWMDTEMLLDMLRESKLLDIASAFDEWIANSDRHHKQIIVGGSPCVVFIDHEQAMGQECKPLTSVANWLLDQQKALMDVAQRQSLLKLVRAQETNVAGIEFGSETPGLEMIANGGDILEQLVSFLNARRGVLDRLLCSRLVPEQLDIESTDRGAL